MLKFISPISFFMAGVIADRVLDQIIHAEMPVYALITFAVCLSVAIKMHVKTSKGYFAPSAYFASGMMAYTTIIKLSQGAWPVSALIGFVVFLLIAIKHSR